MVRTYILFALFFICCSVSVGQIQPLSNLQNGFKNPPSSAKARTWWHWINGNVTKEGITADLEAMKRVGIQEAQLFNLDQGYPEGPAPYMSEKWLELVQFSASEAKRLGLEMTFNNSAGWSSSGGPWVEPQYAMQTVVYSEIKRLGNRKLREALPKPQTKLGYYKDIIVLAFPTPQGKARIPELGIKTLSGDSPFKSDLYPDDTAVDESAIVRKKDIINLTAHMNADGILDWNAPAGEWTIMRIGHTAVGTENRPANKEGRGLECDKMSRVAVDKYWEKGVQPVLDKLGSLVGSSLVGCLIDSYEVGNNNWTEGFEREFENRNGYDCLEYMPTLAGYYVEGGEVSERFLWDFRKTIGDLIVDNYYGRFAELSHQHGLKLSVEPYGGPFDAIQAGTKADIVMAEFWLGRTEYANSPKLVSSIAALSGIPYVGSESFSSIGGSINHPATIKSSGDGAWSDGINRLIFHSYTHQPWNVAPGMTFHMYGLDMNRLNTWWDQGKAYMDYLARSQFLLQQGRTGADILIFTGEASPNDGDYRPEIKALGYDYHEIGSTHIYDLSVKDGWIYTPTGGRYRMLVLPDAKWMTSRLHAKIEDLLRSGATILGPEQYKSPSLRDAGALSQLKNIIQGQTIQDVMKNQALAPDFSAGTKGRDLRFIHRVVDDVDIYFVSNPQKQSREEICRFRIKGKQPQLWNPETGEIKDVPVWEEEEGGTTSIPLSFDTDGSVFVLFKEKTDTDHLLQAQATVGVKTRLLPQLNIVKAQYGEFLPAGLADVTEVVIKNIKDNKLAMNVDNALSGEDPASGAVKELRIEYERDGKRHTVAVAENTWVNIDLGNSTDSKIIRAVYGKFPQEMKGLPSIHPIADVSAKLRELISTNELAIVVDDRLTNHEKVVGDTLKKELRITYSSAGETYDKVIKHGLVINFGADSPKPKFLQKDGKTTWITPSAGRLNYTTSLGKVQAVHVKKVADPLTINGPWTVQFEPGLGAPATAVFDSLTSWSDAKQEAIRYFSGTATYKKKVEIPRKYLKNEPYLELDLGDLGVIAEVVINGKELGILWKAPFRIRVDQYLRPGINDLEIRVTNLWPNRLIGDDRLPDDVEWGEWTVKAWPTWLLNGTKRLSERVTFTTWKHWNKDSKLQRSGLLGPVYIQPYGEANISD